MKSMVHVLSLAAAGSLVAAGVCAAEADGWMPLFNANDLDGWVNVNGAPETWSIKDGVISCTGKPVAALRSPKQYENFELELEWRHLKPAGNAGIFVWASALPAVGQPFLRAIEVQVLDNAYGGKEQNVWFTTHGDIFPIHGATMTPMRPQTHQGDKSRCFPIEFRSKPSPEWNHYRIVANHGSIRLSVNGKEVSGGDKCLWRKGYLGLESEGSPTEWRNIRIKELPGTSATPEESAPVIDGWRPLYNGVDLRGWKLEGAGADGASPDRPSAWTADDWVLRGSKETVLPVLWTDESFGDVEIMIDSRLPAEAGDSAAAPALVLRSPDAAPVVIGGPKGAWHRRVVRVEGTSVKVFDATGTLVQETALPVSTPSSGPIGLITSGSHESRFANIFVREIKQVAPK